MTKIEYMLLIGKKNQPNGLWACLAVLRTACMGSGMIWILAVPPKGRSSFSEGKTKEECLLLAKLMSCFASVQTVFSLKIS